MFIKFHQLWTEHLITGAGQTDVTPPQLPHAKISQSGGNDRPTSAKGAARAREVQAEAAVWAQAWVEAALCVQCGELAGQLQLWLHGEAT